MNSVFSRIPYLMEKGMDSVIVTIINATGSSPRGKGAMMLVTDHGPECGTIGGGAIEGEAIAHAKDLIKEKRCDTGVYDLRPGTVGDIGMECGGQVAVAYTFVDHEESTWYEIARQVTGQIAERKEGWLVLRTDDGLPVIENPDTKGDMANHTMMADQGRFRIALPIGEKVILFGAGHCAKALVPILDSVGFRVTVMDDREDLLTEDRFPQAERRICGDYHNIDAYVEIMPEDYIVVMTNGHSHDFVVQEQVLRKEIAYIGVIGSRRKTAAVNARLREAGIPDDALRKVHTPIGLDIKAVTPEEIAISIAGEMILERAQIKGVNVHGCPMKC